MAKSGTYIISMFFGIAVVALLISAATATSRSLLQSSSGCSVTYTMEVKTGDVSNAGTDSKISVTLANNASQSFKVGNIEDWGTMGAGYDYFERNRLDSFQGNGPCITNNTAFNGPFLICKITLSSDGSGDYPGWYLQTIILNYPVLYPQLQGFRRTKFQVITFNQWLEPGQLSVTKNFCS